MKSSAPLKAAGEIDSRYKETCAQLGQAYLNRLSLVNQLKSLDADIATLKEAAHQHLASYRAVVQAEGVGHE